MQTLPITETENSVRWQEDHVTHNLEEKSRDHVPVSRCTGQPLVLS
jgi:hypothetical protein